MAERSLGVALRLAQFMTGKAAVGPRGVGLIVASALFMTNLDGSIIATSLPDMAADFGVTSVEMNAGIVAYLLSVAAFLPLSGWIADRFGAKRVFAAAILIFALASLACGAASSLGLFILARVAQGLGGALIMPIGRALVLRKAEKHEIVRMTALIVWPALIAPVVGPALGGAITTYVDWRWNFLLNVPLGLAGVLLVLAYVPDEREAGRRPLDIPGAVLASACLILAIYALERLAQPGGSAAGLAMLAASAALGAAAAAHFRRTAHPLLDLRPFRERTFNVAALDAGILHRVAISATPFLLPLMMQVAWGLSAFEAGGLLFLYFCGNLAMKGVTTPLLRCLGFRNILLLNGLLLTATVAACGLLTADTPTLLTGAVLLAAGAARSLQMTALNTLAFADVPGEQRGAAATLSTMLQQIGFALGVAVAAVLLHLSGGAGATPDQADFRFAFLAVGLFGFAGVGLGARLGADDGWEVSGREPRSRETRDR
jgi:EmrB/QacA subfamily drug resistance transporter